MTQAYHIIGIGGVGMSALANILLNKGDFVSGSDSQQSEIIEDLKKKGAKITSIQQKANIQKDQVVVFSSAIKENNPEYEEAVRLQCKMLHRSELLRDLLAEKKELIVVGAHGKTTTTSLLAYVLQVAGMDPSYAIGGFCNSLDSNGRGGKGEYFACEGDESDGSFLKTNPYGAIINNLDADHIGYYWDSYDDLLAAFQTFVGSVTEKNLLVYNGDDPILKEWEIDGVSFGTSSHVDVRVENVVYDDFGMKFDIIDGDKTISNVNLAMIGMHNTLNALGVYVLASRLGIPEKVLRLAFSTFKGVRRRLELKANVHNVLVIDDYAHHPREIKETVRALEKAFPLKRMIKVFQPHRYTRVADLKKEFVNALSDITENLIITDIFPAGESSDGLITTEEFMDALEQKAEFQYVPRESITNYLTKIVEPGDIVLMMGAGDITRETASFAKEISCSFI